MRLNNVRGNWNMKRVVTFCLASGCTASREPGLIYCYYLETYINYVNLLFLLLLWYVWYVGIYPIFSVLESIRFFVLHQILSGVSHSSRGFHKLLRWIFVTIVFVFLHVQQNSIYNVAFECLQFEIHNHELGPKWIRLILSKIHIIII